MNTASNTHLRLTTQVGQAHAATGVLLDLGTNKQPSKPKLANMQSGNLHGLLPLLHRSDRWPALVRPVTSVRPVDRAGQAGGYSTRGSTFPIRTPDLPNRSTDLHKTLGIVGTPHEESIAKFMPTKTCQIERNRRNPTTNSSNPRTPKIPKIEPLNSQIWEGIKGKRTTKGSHKFSPSNPQEQDPKNTPRKPTREGSENHHQEQPRTTQQSLEEPRRSIYTYQRGSYKV
jgi:hypothetical protein